MYNDPEGPYLAMMSEDAAEELGRQKGWDEGYAHARERFKALITEALEKL